MILLKRLGMTAREREGAQRRGEASAKDESAGRRGASVVVGWWWARRASAGARRDEADSEQLRRSRSRTWTIVGSGRSFAGWSGERMASGSRRRRRW